MAIQRPSTLFLASEPGASTDLAPGCTMLGKIFASRLVHARIIMIMMFRTKSTFAVRLRPPSASATYAVGPCTCLRDHMGPHGNLVCPSANTRRTRMRPSKASAVASQSTAAGWHKILIVPQGSPSGVGTAVCTKGRHQAAA